jgi:hypothetical protein
MPIQLSRFVAYTLLNDSIIIGRLISEYMPGRKFKNWTSLDNFKLAKHLNYTTITSNMQQHHRIYIAYNVLSGQYIWKQRSINEYLN